MRDEELKKVLNSTLSDLMELELSESISDPLVSLYAKCVLSFLKSDIKGIKLCLDEVKKFSDEDDGVMAFRILMELRYQVRTMIISLEMLQSYSTGTFKHYPPLLKYELYFVIALGFAKLEVFDLAEKFFKKSYQGFSKEKMEMKAVLAFQNCVTAKINQQPEKSYLSEWIFIAAKSEKMGLDSVCGNALINLAREYQNIGAHHPALKYIDKAIDRLAISAAGTYQYYNALLHKCDILVELGNKSMAYTLLQEALLCPFKELAPSIDIMKMKLGANVEMDANAKSSITWKERLDQFHSGEKIQKLGKLEQKLIYSLGEGSKDKFELMDIVYPEDISFDSKEKRLKVLLSSIRKKIPGLIIFSDGKYYLDISQDWIEKQVS